MRVGLAGAAGGDDRSDRIVAAAETVDVEAVMGGDGLLPVTVFESSDSDGTGRGGIGGG